MANCDWNLIATLASAIAAIIGIYLFFRTGIEKLIQKQTDTLHKDIDVVHKDVMGIKDDIKEIRQDIRQTNERIEKTNERIEKTNERMREESKQANERIDRLYQMFVDLLGANNPKTDP